VRYVRRAVVLYDIYWVECLVYEMQRARLEVVSDPIDLKLDSCQQAPLLGTLKAGRYVSGLVFRSSLAMRCM
jgi:hypothetical protein